METVTPEPEDSARPVPELGPGDENPGKLGDSAFPAPQLAAIAADLQRVHEAISVRAERETSQNAAFELLYAELSEMKRSSTSDPALPVYIDLILLHDRIESIGTSRRDSDPMIAQVLQELREEVLEILARREVLMMAPGIGEFDPARQRAITLRPAPSDSLHNHIANVVRRGFLQRDRIVRAEEVVVFRRVPADPGAR